MSQTATPLASPVLEAVGISRTYGAVVALADVTLQVHAGECVALVGASGSGKTSLLRTFNGLVIPEAGRVYVLGEDVRTRDPVELRRHIGYVPQNGGLLPHWSVLDNVGLVPKLRQMPDADSRAAAALNRVSLPAKVYARRWPRELSGGQRQRVAIARALAADPDVILLDEPFGALDAITRSEVQDTFVELRKELGVTSLLVTHDLREALKLATRIGVMHEGRIVRIAEPADLLANPGSAYVEELFARADLSAGLQGAS